MDGGKWKVTQGKAKDYIALAQIQNNPNATGWTTLDIETNGHTEDETQAFAAGYIEGALTTELIYQSWITQLEFFFQGTYSPLAAAWLAKNDAWVRAQVKSCSSLEETSAAYVASDCDYWYQIGLVLTQLDGMVQGYNDYCDPSKHLTYDIFLYINTDDDLGDILIAVDPSSAPVTPLESLEADHCSVLVKYSNQTQQLYHSHVTWGHYVNMLRTFKHYTFRYNHDSTASMTVSFSSFPGFIASGDDYFITDQGLIVTETTNGVYNITLYQLYVQPATVLYWLRVVVSNRMASNGSEWVSIFGKYNSGTYNNQWQVTDTKLFTSGKPFQPETLYIAEQIPGYVMSADVTSFLINDGYFPSYNVPYFPFIYNISGYASQKALYGSLYSYSDCPRANIFRRDQGKVNTLQDMQNIMRYNEYQTDPLSLGDSCNGVSARCDLNTTSVMAFGGFDCKVSSTELIKDMLTSALSGPTTLTQPPFSWTGPFATIPHLGQPTLFNFSFVVMQPQKM